MRPTWLMALALVAAVQAAPQERRQALRQPSVNGFSPQQFQPPGPASISMPQRQFGSPTFEQPSGQFPNAQQGAIFIPDTSMPQFTPNQPMNFRFVPHHFTPDSPNFNALFQGGGGAQPPPPQVLPQPVPQQSFPVPPQPQPQLPPPAPVQPGQPASPTAQEGIPMPPGVAFSGHLPPPEVLSPEQFQAAVASVPTLGARHPIVPPPPPLRQQPLPPTQPAAPLLPSQPIPPPPPATAPQPVLALQPPTSTKTPAPVEAEADTSEESGEAMPEKKPVLVPELDLQEDPVVTEVQTDALVTTTPILPTESATSTSEKVFEETKAPEPDNLPPVDKTVDLDADGALSLNEVQYAAFVHHGLGSSVVEALFSQVDKNKDGFLNALEFNDIRPLVLEKAENAALRYMQSVDTDHSGLLSLAEAQAYILKEYGIGNRDVERVWKLVTPNINDQMDAATFSKLRRRIRGMTIRLARQIMKNADTNGDGHIDLSEAQAVAFEQEGISRGDVVEMLASVDDNGDSELNAPEFADFERIIRARAVETSKKALKVVDTDGSNTLTLDEAKRIAFEHYGFDEQILGPFFDQADENEDGQLDAVEFAGFRSVIRNRAVKNAQDVLRESDNDGDGRISQTEAEEKTRREDDMDGAETRALFNVADQDRSGFLDKVELADFIRLVRLSAIKFATEHFKEFDMNKDQAVMVDELTNLIYAKYGVDPAVTQDLFDKVDVDHTGDLIPAEIVDFRHEIRKYVSEKADQLNRPSSSSSRLTNEEAEVATTRKIAKTPKQPRKPVFTAKSTTTTAIPTTEEPAPEEEVEEFVEEPEEVITTEEPTTTTVKTTKWRPSTRRRSTTTTSTTTATTPSTTTTSSTTTTRPPPPPPPPVEEEITVEVPDEEEGPKFRSAGKTRPKWTPTVRKWTPTIPPRRATTTTAATPEPEIEEIIEYIDEEEPTPASGRPLSKGLKADSLRSTKTASGKSAPNDDEFEIIEEVVEVPEEVEEVVVEEEPRSHSKRRPKA